MELNALLRLILYWKRLILSKAPPDGYTLLVSGSSVFTFPLLQEAPYDPVRDF
jgi:hypothetical protein